MIKKHYLLKRIFSLFIVIILIFLIISKLPTFFNLDPYKEGELVTWKIKDQLIVKTELGQRRELCKECEKGRGYQRENETFLGQFPIDYQPEEFAPISKAEALALPTKEMTYGNHLEFYLMLNNSVTKATQKNHYYSNELPDHLDQVRVEVTDRRLSFSYMTTKEIHQNEFPKEDEIFDQALSDKYEAECYRNEFGFRCFGENTDYDEYADMANRVSSGVFFQTRPTEPNLVEASSYEPILGNTQVKWYIHKDRLHEWKEIDKNIWRLLKAWNISPIETDPRIDNNPRGDLSKSNTSKIKTGKVSTFQVNQKLIMSVYEDEVNPYHRQGWKDNFLGQFPIDFMPNKPKSSQISEIYRLDAEKFEPLEFVLFRNGMQDFHIGGALPKEQIKVKISNSPKKEQETLRLGSSHIKHLLQYNDALIQPDSEFFYLGMPCYRDSKDPKDLWCMGETGNPRRPEVQIRIDEIDTDDPTAYTKIVARSRSNLYGELSIEWRVTTESPEDWLEIEESIWQVIEALNVAPLDIKKYQDR